MATKGKRAPPTRKTGISVGSFPLPPVSVDANSVREQDWESVMGWIAACVLVALLLPIMAMLLLETLEAKHEVKQQVEKVEKMRRQIEQKEREKQK
jgi:hypothetical protein